MIKKGETKKVTFTLTKKDFEIYNQNMEKVVEPGEFHVFVQILRTKFRSLYNK